MCTCIFSYTFPLISLHTPYIISKMFDLKIREKIFIWLSSAQIKLFEITDLRIKSMSCDLKSCIQVKPGNKQSEKRKKEKKKKLHFCDFDHVNSLWMLFFLYPMKHKMLFGSSLIMLESMIVRFYMILWSSLISKYLFGKISGSSGQKNVSLYLSLPI